APDEREPVRRRQHLRGLHRAAERAAVDRLDRLVGEALGQPPHLEASLLGQVDADGPGAAGLGRELRRAGADEVHPRGRHAATIPHRPRVCKARATIRTLSTSLRGRRMQPTADGPRSPARKRQLKERAVLLAPGRLFLGLLVGLGLKLLARTRLSYGGLAFALAATVVVQGVSWWIVHAGWDAHLRWDPHYVYVPMLLAAFLLNLYMYLAPEARYLILLGWIVALLFMVGLAGFLEVVTLSAVMTAGYLVVLS